MVKRSKATLLKTLLLSSFISCNFSFAMDFDDSSDSASTSRSSAFSQVLSDSKLLTKNSALTFSPTDALKQKVEAYISSIYAIKFHSSLNGESSGHMGTGWMLDAGTGVIVTNHHVVPRNLPGLITIVTSEGEEYTTPDVEIIGTTVGEQFGDFSFLRVRKLADKSKKSQMPIVKVFDAKKRDTLAFMGNSSGSFTVEVGKINDRYYYWDNEEALGSMSVSVDLHAHGGASGSPVFNENAEVVGILFAGNDVHNMILPVTYINDAYEQIKKGQKITAVSFGTPLSSEKIHELARYHHIPLETLREYVAPDQELKLMVAQPITERSGAKDQLEQNDIILTVDGEIVGTDQERLIALLKQAKTHKVEIFRKGELIKLELPTVTYEQSFSKSIDIDGMIVTAADSSLLDRYNLEPETALIELGYGTYTQITGIHKTPVGKFNDFIHTFIDIFEKQKLETFFLYATACGSKTPTAIPIDLRGARGKSMYVTYMDEVAHRWVNMDYKEYDALQSRTPVAAPSAPQARQPRGRKRTASEAQLPTIPPKRVIKHSIGISKKRPATEVHPDAPKRKKIRDEE